MDKWLQTLPNLFVFFLFALLGCSGRGIDQEKIDAQISKISQELRDSTKAEISKIQIAIDRSQSNSEARVGKKMGDFEESLSRQSLVLEDVGKRLKDEANQNSKGFSSISKEIAGSPELIANKMGHRVAELLSPVNDEAILFAGCFCDSLPMTPAMKLLISEIFMDEESRRLVRKQRQAFYLLGESAKSIVGFNTNNLSREISSIRVIENMPGQSPVIEKALFDLDITMRGTGTQRSEIILVLPADAKFPDKDRGSSVLKGTVVNACLILRQGGDRQKENIQGWLDFVSSKRGVLTVIEGSPDSAKFMTDEDPALAQVRNFLGKASRLPYSTFSLKKEIGEKSAIDKMEAPAISLNSRDQLTSMVVHAYSQSAPLTNDVILFYRDLFKDEFERRKAGHGPCGLFALVQGLLRPMVYMELNNFPENAWLRPEIPPGDVIVDFSKATSNIDSYFKGIAEEKRRIVVVCSMDSKTPPQDSFLKIGKFDAILLTNDKLRDSTANLPFWLEYCGKRKGSVSLVTSIGDSNLMNKVDPGFESFNEQVRQAIR